MHKILRKFKRGFNSFIGCLLLLALFVTPAQAERVEFDKGCSFFISAAWDLIAEPENYMSQPRPGRITGGYNEPPVVYLSEGPVTANYRTPWDDPNGTWEKKEDIVALPPNNPAATRFTHVGAFRRFTYVDKNDPNVPALIEAASFLEAATVDVYPSEPVNIPHDKAKQIYEIALSNCEALGIEKVYVDVIEFESEP